MEKNNTTISAINPIAIALIDIKCCYCGQQATSFDLGSHIPSCDHCCDIAMLAAHG